MALLWLFRVFYESKLVVAHFEHGIRGNESREDALFVEDMARRWGIEAVIHHEEVPRSLRKGESLETGARRLRYSFFERMAEERGAYGVALGHNKEDVAETTLFHLLRGSGVRGLVGMPERRGIFFRPLLTCSREFLRDVLRHRGLSWREDRTNEENDCTRNFIRNKLIPAIENGVNARAVDHLAAFADEMRYYREEEERQGDILFKLIELVKPMEGEKADGFDEGCELDRATASGLPLRDRIVLIREVGRRFHIPVLSRERCLELAFLMEGKRVFEFQWGKGTCVLGDRDRIKWKKQEVILNELTLQHRRSIDF
jgi:tRNA(Ile)-lysidine synthase